MAERVTDVGFVGLGDQGGPMAAAIAQAGFPLHVWARRAASLRVLADVPHVVQDSLADLGAACQVAGICVGTDDDVESVLDGGLLAKLRPGSVVVNHGTGLPSFATRLTSKCAEVGVDVLDAPVSGAMRQRSRTRRPRWWAGTRRWPSGARRSSSRGRRRCDIWG